MYLYVMWLACECFSISIPGVCSGHTYKGGGSVNACMHACSPVLGFVCLTVRGLLCMAVACVCQITDVSKQMLEGTRNPEEERKTLESEWVRGTHVLGTFPPHPWLRMVLYVRVVQGNY